jgi:hypothetical protein
MNDIRRTTCDFSFTNESPLNDSNHDCIVTDFSSDSMSYVTTDGQSTSLSLNKAPIWGLRPDFCYCLTVIGLLIWGAVSDERTGLLFTIAASPRQRSHSQGPSLMGLVTIFYCLRFETSPYITSHDSQGCVGGIRPPPPHRIPTQSITCPPFIN